MLTYLFFSNALYRWSALTLFLLAFALVTSDTSRPVTTSLDVESPAGVSITILYEDSTRIEPEIQYEIYVLM